MFSVPVMKKLYLHAAKLIQSRVAVATFNTLMVFFPNTVLPSYPEDECPRPKLKKSAMDGRQICVCARDQTFSWHNICTDFFSLLRGRNREIVKVWTSHSGGRQESRTPKLGRDSRFSVDLFYGVLLCLFIFSPQEELPFSALVQLFDPLLSPRCYAVVGLKSFDKRTRWWRL